MKQKNKYQPAVNKKKKPTRELSFLKNLKNKHKKDDINLITLQGFCIQYEYFYLVKLSTRKIKRICRFSQEQMNSTTIPSRV